MNIKEYISSGILESYALGELSASERAEVDANLARYPELRQELTLVEQTMEALLLQAGRTPAPRVKAAVMQLASKGSEAKVIPLQPRRDTTAIWRYATAASIVIAVASSILAYNFYGNWKKTEISLSELRALNQQVAQDYNTVNQRLNAIENEWEIVSSPAFQRVIMKGTANAPDALASVYWNQTSAEVYLSVQNLKTLAQEQQYQLWAIVDGKPVDMGVFDAPSAGSLAGLLKMKTTGKAAAFAITIEPRGGKPTPSLETMQVLGNS